MLDSKLTQLIDDTAEILELPTAVIEKDYYVTQIIHAISKIENEYFRLIFSGGTCLAKAHKIVKRMSEDVDFKIQIKTQEKLSRSRLIKELKQFRAQIKSCIDHLSEFSINNDVARNEGKYQYITLKYPSFFPTNSELRTEILLEFTLSEIRLETQKMMINTLIENTLKNASLFTPSKTICISISETAIEKWVGLTRRIIAIERGYHADDETLIRHVYDLNAINNNNGINTDFYHLAKIIIENDIAQVKNQHPEYAENPHDEIKASLDLLKNKPLWKDRYHNFLENMVYEQINVPDYSTAIQNIEQMSLRIVE